MVNDIFPPCLRILLYSHERANSDNSKFKIKIVIYLLRILVDKQRSDYIMLSGMSEVVVCFASLDFQIYLQPLKDRQVGRRSEMLQNNTVF